jgi:CHAT domain-containing protein
VLHSIPFQALFDGEKYLIDSFGISYAPSASVLSLGSESLATGRSLIREFPTSGLPGSKTRSRIFHRCCRIAKSMLASARP